MKKKLIVLIFMLCVTFSYSQTRKKITLPLLRENPKIDSLFDSVIHEINPSNVYFSFTTTNLNYAYMFSIDQLKNRHLEIYYAFMLPKYMKNFGYFEYKGCIIFVSGGIDPYNFFKKTSKQKSFDFIDEVRINEPYEFNNLFSADYEYIDGRFSLTTPKVEK